MASAGTGGAIDGSGRGRKKATRRWCLICGRELLTCRRYTSLCSKVNKDPEFSIAFNQIVGEDVPCSTNCHMCEQCDSKISKVRKSKDVGSEIKIQYSATKTKYSGNVVPQSQTSSTLSPSTRATQSPRTPSRTTRRMSLDQKRKAVSSPGTPSTRKPLKKRLSFTTEDTKQVLKAEVIVQYTNSVQTRQLSGLWLDVAAALSFGDTRQAIRCVLNSKDAREELRLTLINHVSREVTSLCDPKNPSLFRGSTLPDLQNFNYIEQIKELESKSPLFSATLHAAAENVAELVRNKQKSKETLIPGITTAAGLLLNCRSQNMNSHQVLTSLALKQSGAKKSAFSHLHSRFVCSSYKTIMQRQVSFGLDFDKEVKEWAEAIHAAPTAEKQMEADMRGFQLVTDNVDIVIHPRYSSREKHGTDLHMVQIIAVQNRIDGQHLPTNEPSASITSVDIAEFLPTATDNHLLKQDWQTLMGNIIAKHIPSLGWLSAHIPAQIPHPHMAELQQKSKIVNLGVLMEDENSTEGIYKIMHHLHKYVPGHGTDTPTRIISAGDLLTCERESSCNMEQRNSKTPSQRLEGLVPVIADFHALANFYQVIWLHLYDTTSSGDKGTLYAARNFLEARRVTTDPMRNINAAADLITQYTHALVIAAAMKYFGMDSIDDHPTKNEFNFATHQDRSHYAKIVLEEIVDQYVVPSNDELKHDSPVLSCPHCEKKYVTKRGLKHHMKSKHPGVHLPSPEKQALAPDKDALFNYTRTAISLCMLAYDFNDARQMGDGERLMRLYKFLLLHFKSAKKPKYSYQVLRLLAQMKCFLSPRLAYELKWNRFVNKTGNAKSNIEVDRELEHQNRVFKENCGGMRGKVTRKSIDRISRSAQVIDELLTAINHQASVNRPSGKHTKKSTKDALDLAMELHRDNVFDFQAGRKHFHFQDFPSSVLSTLNAPDLHKWIKSSFERMSMSN